MRSPHSAVLASSLALLLLTACRSDSGAHADDRGPAASLPKGEGDSEVVARIDGTPITRGELDKKASAALIRAREQEYDARKEALDGLLLDRLYEREAKARSVSREQLLKDEVEAKVPEATPQQVEELYDQNRARVGTRTLAELTPEIKDVLRDRYRAERKQAFEQQLRAKSTITVSLQQPRNVVPIPADAQVMGPKEAKVTLVEFSDYLCPYCQHAQEVVDKVVAQNRSTVRFVHRDFLLGRPRSLAVARAALCAGEQGKFWEFRGSLLNQPGDWSDGYLSQRAASLGLKPEPFASCFASSRLDATIQSSSADGSSIGVDSTPTFFINGRRMKGVRTVEQMQEAIDAEVKSGS